METITTFRDEGNKHTAATHFLLAAIARYNKQAGTPAESGFKLPIEVKLIANGVELPFQETLEDIYRRFSKEADEKIQRNHKDYDETCVVSLSDLRAMSVSELVELLSDTSEDIEEAQ